MHRLHRFLDRHGHRDAETEDRMGGGHRHGPRDRHGHGGRRERVFDQGTLRLVLLRLIAEQPRHGYELIKAIEEMTGGGYTPSPGTIYPTLTLLEEMGHASVAEAEGGRRQYQATEAGRAELAASQATLDEADARMRAAQARHGQPSVLRAVENLKLALRLRLSQTPVAATEIDRIVAVIDDAARAIERV